MGEKGKDLRQMHAEKRKPLSLLTVVVDRDKRDKVVKLLEGNKAFFNLMMLGRGTANGKILGYLGLGETEKAVLFSILPSEWASDLLGQLDAALELKKPGHGIAYRSELREGCYHKPVALETQNGEGDKAMERATTHDVIIVVLNRGYTEEVMDAARAAGATGGTVLSARGCGLEGAEKFFGVTIQPEKELLMIVSKVDTTCAIMSAIAEKNGPGSDSGAVSFSMPANNVLGVGSDVPADIV